MRIYILTMDDPVYSIDFCRKLIRQRHHEIVGITLVKFARFNLGKKRSGLEYAVTLLLIMGPVFFFQNVWKNYSFKIKLMWSRFFSFIHSPSLKAEAEKYSISVNETDNPNSEKFLQHLRRIKPDIIFNQCQSIVRKELLSIPSIGVINKHNALLPKNRGRLTPFWVLKNREKESGVSIHFVNEGIDSGDIIFQEKFPVAENETFKSLVKKNNEIGIKAMIKALDLLTTGNYQLIKNDERFATYNSVPTLKDAIQFRLNRIFS